MKLKDKIKELLKNEIGSLSDDLNYTINDLQQAGLILTNRYKPVTYSRLYKMMKGGELPFEDVSPPENKQTSYLVRGEKLKEALLDYYNLN
jgi:hypothetical protein